MSAELKQMTAGRQEAERKRKQAETQLQEVQIKLMELEKTRTDYTDKTAKLQVSVCTEKNSIDVDNVKPTSKPV